jgi:hypothetical protein
MIRTPRWIGIPKSGENWSVWKSRKRSSSICSWGCIYNRYHWNLHS